MRRIPFVFVLILSLIHISGGGIAPTGGYIVGRKDLVERIATRLTAPGIGGEIGPSLNTSRLMLQGLFLAPQMVAELSLIHI